MNKREIAIIIILILSTLLSIGEFVVAILEVPHIFGILFSAFLIVVNVMYLVYRLKYLRSHEYEYKTKYNIKYEKMGKKRANSVFWAVIKWILLISYVIINMFVITLFGIRVATLTTNNTIINRT